MRSKDRPEVYRGQDYEIRVIGERPDGLRDAYHVFLRMSWWGALGTLGFGYLALNAVFALLYLLVGGVAGARPDAFLDAFFFSIQTMGTIGYGSMYPASAGANALVVAESLCSLVVVALATGLVFARFSRTRARVVFSSRVAISPIDGVPTLMIRVGNERRRNNIVDAAFRLSLMRTQRTSEGVTIYRTVDLTLAREVAPALSRSWMILHRIGPDSPFHGQTPEQLAAADAELTLAVSGVDDTSLQLVHARHTWSTPRVIFGARLADVVSETEDGGLLLDLRRFDDLLPTTATPDFPYRAEL